MVQVKTGFKIPEFAFSSYSLEGKTAITLYFCMFSFNHVCFLLVIGWEFYVTEYFGLPAEVMVGGLVMKMESTNTSIIWELVRVS